jgi:hypothetical protein
MTNLDCIWAGRSWMLEVQLIHPTRPHIKSNVIRAMLDTGTSRTHIPYSFIQQIHKDFGQHLPTAGISVRVSPGQPKQDPARSNVWIADMRLIGANSVDCIIRPDASLQLSYPGYIGVISTNVAEPLIGMDVILQSRLAIDGPNRHATLTF